MKVIVAVAEKNVNPESVVARFHVAPESIRVIDTESRRLLLFSVGEEFKLDAVQLMSIEGVMGIYSFNRPYKLVHRELEPERFAIEVGGRPLGGAGFRPIAGFSIDSFCRGGEGFRKVAELIQRGVGSFYLQVFEDGEVDFLLREGVLAWFKKSRKNLFVSLPSSKALERLRESVDVLVIESNNMHNFSLLREVGKAGLPVVVKKAPGATIEEFLLSVEYIVYEGNTNVILGVGGVLTMGQKAVPDVLSPMYLKRQTYFPVLMEIESGYPGEYVACLIRIAKDVGSDGVLLNSGYLTDSVLDFLAEWGGAK